MEVIVYPQHGREKPIGSVFISYSRADSTAVENIVLRSFSNEGIPYFIDTKDIGSAKTVDAIKNMLGDCQCGVIALSEASIKSAWVWYEAGILEGLGKRVIPFSLVSGDQAKNLREKIPDFMRLYNILEKSSDLVEAVREETFVAGRLRRNPHFDPEAYSELKSNDIQLIFSDIPSALQGKINFGLLLVKFGTEQGLAQAKESIAERDGAVLNEPLVPQEVRIDQSGRKCTVNFILPIHKILGTQFKFFVDATDTSLVPEVLAYLSNKGVSDVGRSGSGETQRVYFSISKDDLGVNETRDGIINNYMFPI